MGLSSIDKLYRAGVANDATQPVDVREQQVCPFVAGRPAGEADCHRPCVECRAGASLDFAEQSGLRFCVCGTNLFQRDSRGLTQVAVVVAPFRDVLVVEAREGW